MRLHGNGSGSAHGVPSWSGVRLWLEEPKSPRWRLLEASFRRLSGRGGPGAGRPSKLYRRAATQFQVSPPQRRYELAAHVLSRALARSDSEGAEAAVRNAAYEWGKQLAAESIGKG